MSSPPQSHEHSYEEALLRYTASHRASLHNGPRIPFSFHRTREPDEKRQDSGHPPIETSSAQSADVEASIPASLNVGSPESLLHITSGGETIHGDSFLNRETSPLQRVE